MTKADLVNEISSSTGYDRRTVAVIVENLTEEIKKSLANGENVYLRGFGSFVLKTRKAKIARNITQKTSMYVPEHNIPYFKPAADFREDIRKK